MVQVQSSDDERPRRFGELLKEARRCIPADTGSFGNVLRFPNRVGKPVTQEEIAQALGVSRVWYAMLEAGRPVRPSVALLDRLCNVLMLDEERRAALFQLGIPEISSNPVESGFAPALEAFARIRASAKRLWSASTIDEALAIAAEEASPHFDDAALVFFVHRVAPGRWEHPFVVDRGMGTRNENFYEELASSLTPARFDEVVLYPALSEPGEVGTVDSYRATSVAVEYEAALAKHKLQRWMFLHARIRSRDGITGGITVKHKTERVYSEEDRAILSAIASLTSLALS